MGTLVPGQFHIYSAANENQWLSPLNSPYVGPTDKIIWNVERLASGQWSMWFQNPIPTRDTTYRLVFTQHASGSKDYPGLAVQECKPPEISQEYPFSSELWDIWPVQCSNKRDGSGCQLISVHGVEPAQVVASGVETSSPQLTNAFMKEKNGSNAENWVFEKL